MGSGQEGGKGAWHPHGCGSEGAKSYLDLGSWGPGGLVAHRACCSGLLLAVVCVECFTHQLLSCCRQLCELGGECSHLQVGKLRHKEAEQLSKDLHP